MGVVTYHTYCRMIGYTVGLSLHGGNAIAMFIALQGDFHNDPEIKTLKYTQFRFITIWNLIFQMLYMVASLLCDLELILKIKEPHKYIDYLRRNKNVFFASIVWPTTLTIFTLFWPIYIYDRELIFPAYIDRALSQVSNHMMHLAILPIVLWEISFLPRNKPDSHKWYLLPMNALYLIYLAVLLSSYAELGIWQYPFLGFIYGTIYFPLFLIAIYILFTIAYFVQWPLTKLIFETCVKEVKIK